MTAKGGQLAETAAVSNLERFRLLEGAFASFSSASERLEQRYEELQKEVEQLHAQLSAKDIEIKHAERLATLGKTAAAVAHEVRNPLGAIKLYLSMLREDLADQKSSLQLIDHVDGSIARIENVVSNILHFAKGSTLVLTPINLHSLIRAQREYFLTMHPQLVGGIELDLKGGELMLGHEDSLRQLFFNLFHNAFQAMEFNGHVYVSTWGRVGDDGLEITVRDEGPGIAPEIHERLFEPFVTNRGNGTGLGLAIVHQIVMQHGGSISVQCNSVESLSIDSREQYPTGAVFQIKFPARREE